MLTARRQEDASRVAAGLPARRDRILVNSVRAGWATDMGGAGGRPVEDGAASIL